MLKACANNPLTAEGNPHARTHKRTNARRVNKETLMAMKTAADATKAVHGALYVAREQNRMRVHKTSPHCNRVVRLHQPNNRDIDTLDDMRDDIEDQVNGMEREPPSAHSSCSRQHRTPPFHSDGHC